MNIFQNLDSLYNNKSDELVVPLSENGSNFESCVRNNFRVLNDLIEEFCKNKEKLNERQLHTALFLRKKRTKRVPAVNS